MGVQPTDLLLIERAGTAYKAHASDLVKVEGFATRAALVTHIASFGASAGQIYLAESFGYRTIPVGHVLYGTDPIPDLPGLMWFDTRTPFHFGWVGDGTEADQKRGNLALTFPGKTVIDVPGDYLFTNSNPIADSFPTGDETQCNWWAVRRAWYIGRDDVVFEIAAGVNFTAAAGSDCSFIQIGQPMIAVLNSLGSGIGATDHVDCNNVLVNGFKPFVDMNGAAQTAATSTAHHFALVWLPNGARNCRISGLSAANGNYYGIGLEGDFDNLGFTDCYVGWNDLTNFPADGIDQKDFGTNSTGVVIEHNSVIDCAFGFATAQAAIDVRNGAIVRYNRIVFSDAYTGGREAIRAQSATTLLESDIPTQIIGNTIIGNASAGLTRGLRIIGANVKSRGNLIRDMNTAIWVTSPRFSSSQDEGYDCGTGLRLDEDTVAGWQADDALISNSEFSNCTTGVRFVNCLNPTLAGVNIDGGTTGWDIETTAAGIRIVGGKNTATTKIDRLGTGSLVISDVQGFTTERASLASIPIDSTGVKDVVVAHGLPFTPNVAEIQVTLQQGSNVTDYVLAHSPMPIASTIDATNVTIRTRVVTASATGGAVVFARVTFNCFQRA